MIKITLFFLMMAVTLLHAEPGLDARARAISDQLRCPVCRGVPISESPSSFAQDMMGVVREKLKAGETDEQILAYFVAHYGEWVLLKPKPKGLNLMIWILPLAILVGGCGIIFFAVRRWTKHPT